MESIYICHPEEWEDDWVNASLVVSIVDGNDLSFEAVETIDDSLNVIYDGRLYTDLIFVEWMPFSVNLSGNLTCIREDRTGTAFIDPLEMNRL